MKRDAEAEELTSRLVRIESTDPGAYEDRIERFVHSWMDDARTCAGTLKDQISIEELEALPERRCIRLFIRRISILSATGWPAECRRGTSRKATMLVV